MVCGYNNIEYRRHKFFFFSFGFQNIEWETEKYKHSQLGHPVLHAIIKSDVPWMTLLVKPCVYLRSLHMALIIMYDVSKVAWFAWQNLLIQEEFFLQA